MAAPIKWEASPTKTTAIDLGTTLAKDTISAAGSEIDNSTGLNTMAFLELCTSDDTALFDTTAPDASYPTIDIYITRALNGTNYEDAPITGGVNQGGKFLISFPIEKNTTAKRVQVGPVLLPPCKFKLYADQKCGATASPVLTAEWEVNIYPCNLESQ